MRFHDHNIGPHRWHVDVYPTIKDDMHAFREWLLENYPNCKCKLRFSSNNSSNRYYEVRGTDVGAITTIKLTWG